MKKAILAEIITYFFIFLFLYTGAAKLMEIPQVRQQLESSPLLGSIAGITSWVLPIAEILIAVSLFIPRCRMKALYSTFALMLLFTVYVVTLLVMGKQLSCSCGGIIEELSPKQHALFNGSCVLLSVMGIVMARRQQSTERVKWLPITSVALLFVFAGWTLFSAFTAPPTLKTGMEGKPLPSFDLLLPDSLTHFNTVNIPAGKPFIVIGFDPFCLHCQAETADIIKNIRELKGISIYYVTPYAFWKMKAFYRHYRLDLYPNITIGNDYRNAFFQHYMATIVPYTAVFDSKKRLKQVFASEANANSLIKAAQE